MIKAAANAAPHVTKQQFVYGLLRDSIIRCELQPGERLVIDELARRFQVSIIPVREALRLLQSEGLVVSVPHVGATVSPISHASIYETFAILEALEVVGARAATKKATEAEIEGLARRVAAMDRAIASGKPAQWADLNTRLPSGDRRDRRRCRCSRTCCAAGSITGIACAATTSGACSPGAFRKHRPSTTESSTRSARVTPRPSNRRCARTISARSRRTSTYLDSVGRPADE